MGGTALSYRLCLSVARSPSQAVLAGQEPKFPRLGAEAKPPPGTGTGQKVTATESMK